MAHFAYGSAGPFFTEFPIDFVFQRFDKVESASCVSSRVGSDSCHRQTAEAHGRSVGWASRGCSSLRKSSFTSGIKRMIAEVYRGCDAGLVMVSKSEWAIFTLTQRREWPFWPAGLPVELLRHRYERSPSSIRTSMVSFPMLQKCFLVLDRTSLLSRESRTEGRCHLLFQIMGPFFPRLALQEFGRHFCWECDTFHAHIIKLSEGSFADHRIFSLGKRGEERFLLRLV